MVSPVRFVDAHHHLWDLDANYYPWLMDKIESRICGDYTAIRRNYLIDDYFEDLKDVPIAKSVHVQAEHDERAPVKESEWLQDVANDPSSQGFPHAIVGYADFSDRDIESILEKHSQFENFRGIRQTLHHHPERLTDQTWCDNFALLERFNLTFDLQIFPSQCELALALVDRYQNIQFVLCHAGLPTDDSAEAVLAWRKCIAALAKRPNVVCKVSGLGMFYPGWPIDAIRPIVEQVVEHFGAERIMVGSNYPVDKLTTEFRVLWSNLLKTLETLSDNEREKIFAATAEKVYGI